MDILLLGFAFALPYHVMRCAAAAGHRITVLGNGPAQGLLRSPSCTDLYLSDFDYRSQDYRILVQEIAHLSIAIGFDLVMPSDDVSTRALAAIREEIPLPATLLPTVEIFDTLNDMVRFTHFCAEHGIPVRDDLGPGALGITALCQGGKVVAHVVEERSARQLRIHEAPDLVAAVARLIEASNFEGILHCGAVIDRVTGLFHLTRCRPCFALPIHPTMIAGLNFADTLVTLSRGGLPPQSTLPPTTIKLYPAALRSVTMPWRLSRRDWRMLRYHLRERELFLTRVDGSDVFVRAPEEYVAPAARLAG
jgi:hypothetical protein